MVKETQLDTHVIVWLYYGKLYLISRKAKDVIEGSELFYSPIVKLELQYLKEIDKISDFPNAILSGLKMDMGLKESDADFAKIVDAAIKLTWTQDPFDRLIVANASVVNSVLLTKDEDILKNYKRAVW